MYYRRRTLIVQVGDLDVLGKGPCETYTLCMDEKALLRAHELCDRRSAYQRGLLLGSQSLSGATLKPSQRISWHTFKRTRDKLLERMTDAAVPWREARGPRGKRILIVGWKGQLQ